MTGCATAPIVEEGGEEVVEEKTENEILVGIAGHYGLVADEIPLGVRIYLPKLSFDYNSVKLSSEAEGKLHFISLILNSDLAMKRRITISGHADSLGAPENNLKVSMLRAQAVAERLASHAVDTARLSEEWHGDERPIIPNQLSDGSDNPEGRAVNRRVEIIILNL